MFTIQIQCATIEDAERVMATLKWGVAPKLIQDVAVQVPPDRADDVPLLIENESAPVPGTLDAARAALKALQARHGVDNMAVPLEVLSKFSAGRISEVQPDQYPAFIAACDAS
jgi:hypothetical protein